MGPIAPVVHGARVVRENSAVALAPGGLLLAGRNPTREPLEQRPLPLPGTTRRTRADAPPSPAGRAAPEEPLGATALPQRQAPERSKAEAPGATSGTGDEHFKHLPLVTFQ